MIGRRREGEIRIEPEGKGSMSPRDYRDRHGEYNPDRLGGRRARDDLYARVPPLPRRRGGMSTAVKVLLIVGGIGLLLVVGCGVLILIVATAESPFAVTVESPEEVVAGETFVITVDVTNESKKRQTLTEIDISTSYLDGIDFVSVSPEQKSMGTVPIVDMLSLTLDIPFKPGEKKTIVLELKAAVPGNYWGDLDVNTILTLDTTVIRTRVLDAEEAAE